MSSREPEPTTETHRTLGGNLGVSRRGFMRTATAGGAAAAVGGGTFGATWGVTQPASAQTAPTTGESQIIAVNALYEGLTDLFSSGYDPEEADDREANNIHWNLYDSASASAGYLEGFHTELSNLVQPSDPTSGAVENIVWGEIRAQIFESIQNGDTTEEAYEKARDTAQEYITTRQRNNIRQFNEWAVDVIGWVAPFLPWETIASDLGYESFEAWTGADHSAGETNPDIGDGTQGGGYDLQDHASGLSPGTVFDWAFVGPNNIGIATEERELADGTTEDSYTILAESGAFSLETSMGVAVTHPDDGDNAITMDSDWWAAHSIRDALETIETETNDNLQTYVNEVYSSVSAGDIEAMDLMGPTEWVLSNDSGTVERLTSEYMALGMLPPANGAGTLVEVSSPDLEETREGHFFVNWDFSRLNSWEYSYDPTTGEESIEIDADSFRAEAAYTFTFSSTGDVAVDAADFTEGDDDYTYSFTDAGLGDSETLDNISVDAVGELNAFVPVGETITIGEQASHAVIAFEGADDNLIREPISSGAEITVEAVGGDDSEGTRLQLEGYNQQTRDPARSVKQVAAVEENKTYVSEMDEDAPIIGGGGSGNGWFSGDFVGIPIIGWIAGGILGLGYLKTRGD